MDSVVSNFTPGKTENHEYTCRFPPDVLEMNDCNKKGMIMRTQGFGDPGSKLKEKGCVTHCDHQSSEPRRGCILDIFSVLARFFVEMIGILRGMAYLGHFQNDQKSKTKLEMEMELIMKVKIK